MTTALARLRAAYSVLTTPRPTYLRQFSIPEHLVARGVRQAVAGRRLSWQTTTPQYPPASFRAFVARGYRYNAVLRRCIDMLAHNFCQGRLVVKDSSGGEVPGHEMIALFRRGGRVVPVPGLTERTLWTQFIQDAFLFGNALWEKVRSIDGTRVVELWRLDPQFVAVEPDERTGVARYLYQVGGKWWPIATQDVVHWRFPDPIQDYFGIPPVFSAHRDLAVDNELVDHLKITLQNYGVPPIVLESDADVGISDDEADEAQERFLSKYGRTNRGKPAVLNPGTKVRVVGMDFQKMAIGALVATSESRIATVHGVPMILLGRSGTQSDPTRANYQQAKEHFWFDTILSLQGEVGDQVTTFLVPEWGEALIAGFDNTEVPTLQEAKLRRAETASKIFVSGMVSRHRAQRLAGVGTHGPDVLYRSSSIDGIIPVDATEETIELTDL